MAGLKQVMGAGLAVALGVPSVAAGQVAAKRPALQKEQAVQLFEAAGFSMDKGRPVNRCGGASNPRIAFVDLNGDGRAEAHVADVDPKCYGKPGAYFAILVQQPDGRWQRLIGEDGIVGFARTRTAGWSDLQLEARDSACPGVRRYGGSAYGPATSCAAGQGVAVAAKPVAAPTPAPTPAPASARRAPVSREKLVDWDGDQTPEAKAFPVAERHRLFRAAGIQPVKGGRWTSCTEDPTDFSEAKLAMLRDVNGDGRPEALIHDFGSFCNGFVGVGSIVLTTTAAGSWKVIFRSQGYANFMRSRGADNYPDLEIGLTGNCFPYWRWNGAEYDLAARLDDKGRSC